MVAFFTMEDGRFTATPMAVSAWSSKQVAGTGVCGLLAREMETLSPGVGFVPARFTADLFRPVLNEPIVVRGEIVRDGKRVRVIDASIVQQGEVRARGSVMYLAVGQEPSGRVWQAERELPMPERELNTPGGDAPLFKSGEFEWSSDFASGQTGERKAIWQNLPALVEGERISAFQRAAFIGDTTNLACNWGTEGVGYINSDVTVTLSRVPEGHEVGLVAVDRVASDGVMVGTAVMYDRSGVLGTCVATGVSNVRRQVDMAEFSVSRE
ncbi:acyl-CoA thioesterase domain-containing protein [Nocardia acidivorans]|uniref:acyl-CoA thioesterase domain-containing protein n=1 Tax=Nocardia acidivorans TaxID=404580 RepID=UPI00082CF70F|nr:acyl-CoA thioesterase domain-containing protein [Nocardia acidivorans]